MTFTLSISRSLLTALCALCMLGFGLATSGCQRVSTAEARVSTLPYYGDATFTPHWFASEAEVPADFHRIGAFTVQDQRGAVVTEADFAGKLYIANFFFAACPGICPMTMANMKRLQAEFANHEDVLLISHSVTPERDSVAVLREFAERTQVLAAKWYVVTGEREHLYDLGKRSYFAEEDLGASLVDPASTAREEAFLHTESFFLVDGQRRIRGVYNGMNTAAVTQLIADVQTLQQH
ncbi:MAG: SCO family protein [Rhodothermales bacterium]